MHKFWKRNCNIYFYIRHFSNIKDSTLLPSEKFKLASEILNQNLFLEDSRKRNLRCINRLMSFLGIINFGSACYCQQRRNIFVVRMENFNSKIYVCLISPTHVYFQLILRNRKLKYIFKFYFFIFISNFFMIYFILRGLRWFTFISQCNLVICHISFFSQTL